MTGDHSHPLGATPLPDGRCRFLVYAPFARAVEVLLPAPAIRAVPLEGDGAGYHHGIVDGVAAGTPYLYRLDGAKSAPIRPRATSLMECTAPPGHRPGDVPVAGPGMARIPLASYILYELHVGTFTPEGTFDAVIPRLDSLADAWDHGRGDHAGGPVPRETELGLRRRLPVRGAEQLRRAGRAETAGRRLPPARAGGRPRRGLQPPGSGGQLPVRLRALLHRPVPHPVGAGRELRRPGSDEVRRYLPRERALLAARSSTSTRCASTRSTASSTSAPALSLPSSPGP